MDIQPIITNIMAVVGTGLAIYQFAVINESKKRKGELQYLLAGINSSVLQKQTAWANQISLIQPPQNDAEWHLARTYIRARDDLGDIASLTVALEGAIDSENSAISSMMDKYIDTVKKNNVLQEEAQKNPTAQAAPTRAEEAIEQDQGA